MNRIAGTSELHYNDFKKQVFEFSNKWRNYPVPMLFKQQKFTTKNYKELPVFRYQNRVEVKLGLSVTVITVMSINVFFGFEIASIRKMGKGQRN